ncbi:MAG: hypothetical protein BWY52_02875 [Chloroflexi bacterium ADurb.Bin325]|nr:MAG: hypothetical protein BWY52_02875 [Chloroflexi bacterium ADurb.Bin325]
MEWYAYPLLVLAGIAAGFVNMLAGNGSLITLPALIFVGLPANVANATNRVGVTLQNLVGSWEFYRRGKLDTRNALMFAIPTTVGSILGAQIAVDINEALFRRVLAVIMVVMLVLMLVKPERWLIEKIQPGARRLSLLQIVAFFAIGIYGGFLQAGVGIFLLVALVLGAGYDVVRANAIKVLIVLALTLAALVVFWTNAKIEWLPGAVCGVGNMIGAWLGTRFAVRKGAVWVRWFVVVVVLASAAQLLGVFDWIGRLIG